MLWTDEPNLQLGGQCPPVPLQRANNVPEGDSKQALPATSDLAYLIIPVAQRAGCTPQRNPEMLQFLMSKGKLSVSSAVQVTCLDDLKDLAYPELQNRSRPRQLEKKLKLTSSQWAVAGVAKPVPFPQSLNNS